MISGLSTIKLWNGANIAASKPLVKRFACGSSDVVTITMDAEVTAFKKAAAVASEIN